MTIQYNSEKSLWNLKTPNTSYIIGLEENILVHLYYGERIENFKCIFKYPRVHRSFSPNIPLSSNRDLSLDTLTQEFPGGSGIGDFREPSYEFEYNNGSFITDLRYIDYKITKGKEKLQGLPATYVESEDEADTLTIELSDEITNVTVYLIYNVYNKRDVITRSVKVVNNGIDPFKIKKLMSMNIDFNHSDFDLLQLSGSWIREREVEREKLYTGIHILDSKRGSSSHYQQPFVALLDKGANEDKGSLYAFHLVYSGSFSIRTQVDPYKQVRLQAGLNPDKFSWILNPRESFQSPEVVMVYTDKGLNEMSNIYHKLYKERLMKSKYKESIRPILINNWEATYFDFTEEKILNIAKVAKEVGIEMLVLDDGWFKNRDSDKSSLGDWIHEERKLPNGIDGLAKKIHESGMKFGLWLEPEMISENSDLYRKHPDWALCVKGRSQTLSRNQMVLDLSREEVREEILAQLYKLLDTNLIDYIKWDMNRNITDIGSLKVPADRQLELYHRYILGLYDMLEKITERYPNILFESCSGGGGRFDPGMLYYMPQTWISDNSDAVARLKIQYGTSFVYPPISMGCHISDVPNHQLGRITSLDMRAKVAMSGNLGYELDLSKITDEEKKQIIDVNKFYKEYRETIQLGDFYRLSSPFEEQDIAWQIVSKSKKQSLVYLYTILTQGGAMPNKNIKLRGLKNDLTYIMELNGELIGEGTGEELMNYGIYFDRKLNGDFIAKIISLKIKDY